MFSRNPHSGGWVKCNQTNQFLPIPGLPLYGIFTCIVHLVLQKLKYAIFVAMAQKKKKKLADNPKNKPNPSTLKQEKEENIDWRKLVRDERTWKITGAVSLLISIFLFIAFISYLFTWKEDQDKVSQGASILFDNDIKVNNLLGRLGAYISHYFIYKGFGVASLLICTFFFVVGVNLLFTRRVFSISRNLKYVTVGLLVLSVSLAFIFSSSIFRFGGGVGAMISNWLVGALGNFGTTAVLLVLALAYIIWQFNPSFNIPARKTGALDMGEENPEIPLEEAPVTIGTGKTINDIYNENSGDPSRSNSMKSTGAVVLNKPAEEARLHEFKVIEKVEEEASPVNDIPEPSYEKEIVDDLMHEHEYKSQEELKPNPKEEAPPRERPTEKKKAIDLELEIKTVPEESLIDEIESVPAKPAIPERYDPVLDLRNYQYPTLDLLENHGSEKIVQDANELENNKNQIIATLRNYAIEIQKIFATVGPTVTLYEIIPAAGVRISRIKNLEDDIALSLAALGIRIIAPIPGKGTIGIEVPNARKTVVSMKTLLSSEKFQHNNFSLPIAIGKRIDNENFIVDLASMPHLLMAGATGQGKSVGLNAILVSLLYKKHPSQLKLVLVDPKKVELSIYRTIEQHFLAKLPNEEEAIITDTKKVINTLNALCIEMDNRYDLLKEAGCRNIKEYNDKFMSRKLNPEKGHQYLPFIVLVVDEFADLIMTAGKEIEMPIARLAQLARAVGIHLIIATQRPSVNIITGTIKANFPARIAFKVSSKIDSRTILDTGGAEQLIGKGDMLISYNGEVVRLQCAFVDTPEVDKITDFIGYQDGYPVPFLLPEYIDEKELEGKDFDMGDRDSLFEDAARLIVQNQIGSTSLLQRRMKLGYNRAGRLMDQLEAAGIVGPNQGSKARDVLIKTEIDLQQHLDSLS